MFGFAFVVFVFLIFFSPNDASRRREDQAVFGFQIEGSSIAAYVLFCFLACFLPYDTSQRQKDQAVPGFGKEGSSSA